MNVENLKVLQLGKFYPIRGGVEKVAFDLMKDCPKGESDVTCCVQQRKGRNGLSC